MRAPLADDRTTILGNGDCTAKGEQPGTGLSDKAPGRINKPAMLLLAQVPWSSPDKLTKGQDCGVKYVCTQSKKPCFEKLLRTAATLKSSRGWRDGSGVKSICNSFRGPWLGSQP